MTFGLTTDGFVQKTVDDVKTELEAALRSNFGESIDLAPQSVFGQLVGVMAERFADLWSLGGSIHAAFTPDGASGTSLDDVCAITGTVRHAATSSDVEVLLVGTTGTVIALGSAMSVEITGVRFLTNAEATLAAATAWAATTAYAVGAVRKNSSKVYLCTTAGTSGGSGPSTTAAAIVDGSVVWRYVGGGDGFARVAASSEDTGPKVAAAYTLNGIASPVAGWNGVVNELDATLGSNLESDAALRARREVEIRAAGKASVDAIRAALLEVTDVTAATVYENPTDATDVNGVPPHAIECLVIGGTDADVAASIFDEKAAGIGTYGSTTETVTDSQGNTHDVSFSRPTEIDIYVVLNLTVDASLYPVDGDAQVKAAIVAWGDAQKAGKDAVASAILARAFSVAGLLDGVALIGTAPAPGTSVTVPISVRQLAVYDTSRITVNTTPGTP